MDIAKIKDEYVEWKEKYQISVESEDILLIFLKEKGYLCVPEWNEKNSWDPYILLVQLCTDGDFCCKFDHPNLRMDAYETYSFAVCCKSKDREGAVREAVELLNEISDSISAGRDYLKLELNEFFQRAIYSIEESGYSSEIMGGNYEGTFINFFGPASQAED